MTPLPASALADLATLDQFRATFNAQATRPRLLVAWDVWLLYPAGTTWDATAPVPDAKGRTIIKTREALDAAIRALPVSP